MRMAFLFSRTGAMFGLDARIAVGIFSVLSVAIGSYVALSLNGIRAQSLAKELNETAEAIEGIHHDLKDDIFTLLSNPSDADAFTALYDNSVLQSGQPRARWLGPYIHRASNMHASFGEMRITKASKVHNQPCEADISNCQLWITLDATPVKVAEHTNEIFDGKNEDNAALKGRVQWGTTSDPRTYKLWFKAAAAL